MSKKKAKRNFTSMVVEPFKQIKVGLYVVGISVIFILLMAGMFTYAFIEQYRHVAEIFSVVDPGGQWELTVNDVFMRNGVILASLFISYLAVMIFVVFKMTHKVYGPLVSIHRFINQLNAKEYHQRLRIRKGDELQKLVTSLNQLAENLDGSSSDDS